MRRFRFVFSAILAAALATGAVSGAGTVRVTYDFAGGMCSIAGETAYFSQPVKLEILKAGESFTDEPEGFSKLYYIKQGVSGSDKGFSFSIPMPPPGAYAGRVSVMGAADTAVFDLLTYTDEQVAQALSEYLVDAESTAADLKGLLTRYGLKMGLTYQELALVPPDALTAVCEAVNGNKPQEVRQLTDTLVKGAALALLNGVVAATAEKIAALEKHSAVLGVSGSAAYEKLRGLTPAQKAQIWEGVEGVLTAENLGARLNGSLLAFLLGNCLWNEIPGILQTYLEADIDGILFPLGNTARKNVLSTFQGRVKNGLLTDPDAFEPVIRTLAADAAQGDGGGGGGGGGKKTGGYSAEIPVPVQIDIAAPPAQAQGSFDDLESVLWAKDAIETLAREGIVNGKGPRRFAPGDEVAREEFIKMLMAALSLSAQDAQADFQDVPKDAWYYAPIAGARALGIVSGVSETHFGIGERITRQDIAVMTYRALSLSAEPEAGNGGAAFDDLDLAGDYARASIVSLTDMGLIRGTGENRFEPLRGATRAEAAQLIFGLLKYGS